MEPQAGVGVIASIDFGLGGNLAAFHHTGFSESETAGTWSIGTQSSILLPAEGELSGLSLRLLVQPCLLPGQIATQSLNVLLDDVVIGSYSSGIADWMELRFNIPGKISAPNGLLRLTFRHPTPVTPAATGGSSDVRALAFMFRSLTLSGSQHRAPQPPASLPEPIDWSSLPEIHRGKDGWLFLIGGSNAVLRYYHDAGYFTDIQAQTWADLLIARKARLAEMGVRYLHVAAPDKISVYPEQFVAPLPQFDRHPTRLLAQRLQACGEDALLIDPLPTFRSHPEHENLYLRTDTHWTYRAGQLVLELVADRLGHPRRLDLTTRTISHYDHVLDLGSKVEPSVTERNYAVKTHESVQRIHTNRLAQTFEANIRDGRPVTHGSIYAAFRNTDPAAIDQILVIFGDSFMDFQDSNTTTIFAENFREVHFVWSPNIDYDFVARVGAQLVISELAERFMISLPTDDYVVIV